MTYFFVLTAIGLACSFIVGGLAFSYLVAPHHPGRIKNMPYECGEQTIGLAWVQFNVGYYLFGLLFLVFDVEAAFLFPWAVAFRSMGVRGLVEVGVFLLVLILGLVYAWKKRALEWV